MQNEQVLTLNTENFDTEVIKSGVPVLVKFGADWCSYCSIMDNILKDSVKDYEGKVKFANIDVDAEPEIRERYGIVALPTILLYKNGAVAAKKIGAMSKQELNNFLGAARMND
ncbi:MAG: thioredoxin family protein [Spirochaetaceae bacterium]|jgi:thioredoxin 1|nr:thioredoxin family protein [Spirochaetaceae bacterium]